VPTAASGAWWQEVCGAITYIDEARHLKSGCEVLLAERRGQAVLSLIITNQEI
jgi:hypothetical protein